MHRRPARIGNLAAAGILTGLMLLLLLASAAGWPAAAGADETFANATIGTAPSGQPMPSGFVGVSLEYRAVHAYTGRDPTAVNPLLLRLLRGLAPRQTPSIRIGGDSTDQTWWPMRRQIAPGAIDYGLSKGWMRTTHALAAALGAKLILGVNLAAKRPALAAAEARALIKGVGRRYISALEIGNEPDLYTTFAWYQDRSGRTVFARPRGYNLRALIREFSRWSGALPALPLAGPAFSSLAWLSGLNQFISSERKLALVTFHRYPLRGCVTDPSDPSFASIDNLLSDGASGGLAASVLPYVAIAHAHGMPFRLDELNSASCRGRPGVSDTFGSALWVLDTLFNVAAVGVDGVNLHTLPNAPYQPFAFTHDASGWHAVVHPVYYGAMLFAQAFPPGARLLPVSVPGGPVKVWATRDGAGAGATRVVVINKQANVPVTVNIQISGVQLPAWAVRLTAPSLTSTGDVSLGGQSFGAQTDTAALAGSPTGTTIFPSSDGSYTVQLAPGSATMLTL